jgi:cytoskeletal protein CcmA (bactofilin family)
MSIWKDQTSPKRDPIPMQPDAAPKREADIAADLSASNAPRRAVERDAKESLIAANLFIEGKIQGSGDVRIAGQFKGDVDVQGDLTIEVGAKLTGSVRASKVVLAGELDGNVIAASRVELLATGVVNGDLKTGSLTVAAGSHIRGQVEVGAEEKSTPKSVVSLQKTGMENGTGS